MTTLPYSIEICRKLFNGYQFSESDLSSSENEKLYTTLSKNLNIFQEQLKWVGFNLIQDNRVIFLENEDKNLSNEDKQTIVILFLLADLSLEKGKTYADLISLRIPWAELDWFRDGYSRQYLIQVGIEEKDESLIENIFKKLSRKGIVDYYPETRSVTLRRPAERLINFARKIHQHIKKDITNE